jgi:hypothetical protein
MFQRRLGGHHARFTDEDDAELHALVLECGVSNWQEIADRMVGRNARQCRERWKHYLSGQKLHVPWTKQEDDLLLDKVQELGPKWTKIAAIFADRTDLEVKTRWFKKFNLRSSASSRTRRRSHRESFESDESDIDPPSLAPPAIPAPPPVPPVKSVALGATTVPDDDLFGGRDFVEWGPDDGAEFSTSWDIYWI